jgi:Trehalose utilisation
MNRLHSTLLSAGLALGLVATGAQAQNGPITSRLTTAKFSLMKGNWGSDHNSTTPVNFKWMAQIMADSGISVDTFNLNTSQAPLTQANLDKYDVMVWYNVYRMYEFFTAPAANTGNRIQTWYETGNKGLACFHQCVRHSGWTWWGTMMGREYDNFAGNTTGPVWLDAEGFPQAYGPTSPDTVNQSYSWNDEWYVYTGNPRGTPGTKMVWTTKRSAFPTSGWNMTAGEDKPVTWFREFGGGRFSLNGMYHTSVLATTTNPALRSFFNRSFIANMRFLAGYDGCKDSTYVEYNPKATHQKEGACVTPAVSIAGPKGQSLDNVSMNDFKISFSQPGWHRVEIFDTRGSKVLARTGEGSREYRFAEIREPGVYYARITTQAMKAPVNRRIVLY